MSFPAYQAYQDSGVEWLGRLPSHWVVWQSRRLFSERKERTREGDRQLTASQKLGIVYQEDFIRSEGAQVVQVITGADILKHVEPNDFVISMRSFEGGLEYSAVSGCISSAYVMLIPAGDIHSPFFKYAFKSRVYIQALQATTNLVRDGQALRYGNFCQVPLALPSLGEQRAIAAFLDRETAKIDALVEAQERLIALLKEKRQAVISHAVTKGLDPSAHMKDSGVEWLGQVPAHWEVTRLDRVMSFQSGKAHEPYLDDDGAHLYVSARFVSTQGESVKRCTENLTPAARGDIAMVMSDLPNGRALARAFQITDDASYAINQRVCRLSDFVGHSRFYLYQLNRNEGLLRHDDGVNQTHLSNDEFRKLELCFPPMDEQKTIADYLDRITGQYDALANAAQSAITLLQERRAALISAAVTGKIDVRGLVQTAEAA